MDDERPPYENWRDLYDSGDEHSDGDDYNSDRLFHGGNSEDEDDSSSSAFFWSGSQVDHQESSHSSASHGEQTAARGSSSSSGRHNDATAGLVDTHLQSFAKMWLDFKMTEQELSIELQIPPHRVKALRAQCRELGLAAPAACAGRVAPSLPTADEFVEMWVAGALSDLPVATALETLAADPRVNVTVRQLRRHFRAVGFSPRHPMPEEHVLECLRQLIARPWCNRLGPNFARCDVVPALQTRPNAYPYT